MPYISERARIEDTVYDRRRKLTPEQTEEIRGLFGVLSANKTAKRFNVSKRTVQFIWHPDKREENVRLRRERGTVYITREEHTDAVRSTRQYKQELYVAGKIKLPKEIICQRKRTPTVSRE
ncbi:MAG: hypothetical protein WC107_07415 [Patescibacteria group bacterium]